METFLNLAHRSHRKAEFYTCKHQFIEAIFHYTKASTYLEKAILCTRSEGVRSSLIVQRDHCTEQIHNLTRRLDTRVEREVTASEQQNKKQQQQQRRSPHDDTIRINMDSKDIETKYRELYNVMNEHDTLLSHIFQADADAIRPILASGVATVQAITTTNTASSSRVSPIDEMRTTFRKKPKDDKEKIEELKVVNNKLRNWVDHLVEQLERSQKEVLRVREENLQLRKEKKTLEERLRAQQETTSGGSDDKAGASPSEPPKLLY